MIGQTISHYKILEKIGAGGMGVVYKAEDIRLKRTVALKFLPPALSQDELAKTRFMHEAQTASSLDHPNICSIYEIDETEDYQSFIAMAYYEGQTLKQKIKEGNLTTNEAVSIAVQIAKGLNRAHEAGIVHRDIKPANIMVTNRGEIKILDFGLAKLAGQTRLTLSGSTMGTIAYMSPEQCSGGKADQRSDLWSLGVLLYEMLYGFLPFKGEYEQALIYSVLNEEPEPLPITVDEELQKIIYKLLQKEPDKRYQSARELLHDFSAISSEADVKQAGHPFSFKVKALWENKKVRIAVLSISFLLLALLLSIIISPFTKGFAHKPRSIAVLSFVNQTGDPKYDRLGQVFQNLLMTSLGQTTGIRVLSRERMLDILEKMGDSTSNVIDEKKGFSLCRRAGMDALVIGSFTIVGGLFVTDVKVLDVKNKEILVPVSVKGEGEASILHSQIDDISLAILSGLGVEKAKLDKDYTPAEQTMTGSMEAYNYYLSAKELYRNYDLKKAEKLYLRAIVIDSTFTYAYVGLADVYYYINKTKVPWALEQALKYMDKLPEKYQLNIKARVAFNQNDPEKMYQITKEMTQKYPEEISGWLHLAGYYSQHQQYRMAIENELKVLELEPHNANVLNGLAYDYAIINKREKALHYIQLAKKELPGKANIIDCEADVLWVLGDTRRAIAKLKETIELYPGWDWIWKSYNHLVFLYAYLENYPEAIKMVDQIWGKSQENYISTATGCAIRAMFYAWIGDYGRMQEEYETINRFIRKLKPTWTPQELAAENSYFNWFKFHMYAVMGEYGKSLQLQQKTAPLKILNEKGDFEFERWREIPPLKNLKEENEFEFDRCRAFNYIHNAQADSAHAYMRKVQSFIPKIVLLDRQTAIYKYEQLYALSLFYSDSFDKLLELKKERRERQFKFVENGYGWKFLLENLYPERDVYARAYLKKGMLKQAITEYEHLLYPDSTSLSRFIVYPLYHYRLARLYEQSGQSEKAKKEYQIFIRISPNADKYISEVKDVRERLANLVY